MVSDENNEQNPSETENPAVLEGVLGEEELEIAETGSAAETSTESAGDASALQRRLEESEQQCAELKEQVLRAQAETQNVRRRAERDVEAAHKYALEKFSADLLPVVDNLERALETVDQDNEALKTFSEGVALTYKSFLEVLKKFNIELLDPVGEPFDPQLHEAVAMLEAPDAEPGSVLNVMQKGYLLNGRLVRAAMVVVSKPAPRVNEQV